jgi:hypothetical protein
MPSYRYTWDGVSAADLARQVPGTVVVGPVLPEIAVVIDAETAAKGDLDEYMSTEGWTFDAEV